MSNFSVSHLIKCITQKDKYKFTQQYLKQVEMQNQNVYDIINEVLGSMLVNNTHHPTAKLYALRFFKDLILSAQFQLIDSLDESIIKQIVKISQFDKENKQKLKRGSSYFQQVEKRNKQPQLQKISYSYVLLATEIIYVLGSWHAVDENNQQTDYAFVYQKLIGLKVPFPANDKELKFFKPQQKELFLKNYKEWVEKLPQIEQLSDQDDKQNLQKSRKQIKSKQIIPLQKEPVQVKQTNKVISKQTPIISNNYDDVSKLGYGSDQVNKQQKNQLQKRIKQLQSNLEQVNTSLNAERKTNLQIKQKYSILETKNSQLESKCILLQTQLAESQKNYKEAEQNRQRLHIESQQQKLLVKKISLEKTDMQEKLNHSLKQSNSQLKQAQQKICRLQRQIEQLNTIKNSYKSIMEDHNNNHHNQNNNILQEKVKELQKQIEQLVEFYTKEQIEFKDQIKALRQKNQELEKEISQKDSVIQNIQSSLEEKNHEIIVLKNRAKNEDQNFIQFKQDKVHNETKKSTANFFNSQPQLKIPIQQKTSNSMSQYLLNQTSIMKKVNQSKQNSFDTLKSRQNEHQQKRNASLGKTQKSLQKRKQMINRYSNGKSFHFTNGDPYKSNEIIQNNLQKRPYLGLGRHNGHSSSSGDLWAVTPKVIQQKDMQFINKKSSVLNLNKKRQHQQHSLSKHYGVQTLIPYIRNYFPQNQIINQQNSFLFKSLCLFPEDRAKQTIFKNDMIQVRMINDFRDKQNYVLQITNLSYGAIKVQIVSSHEQFKIIGQKLKLIYSSNTSQYRLQTKVKDLNLRYPVISLIVSSNLQQKVTNSTYNVALPLTMLKFTQMKDQIPQLCSLESQKIKIIQSEKFILNQTYSSLKQCFPNLVFQNKLKSGGKSSKSLQQYWQGNLHHSFIENIDVYLKMVQVQNKVSLQFWFRNNDKISQNYSKVMIQTFMYLLQ